MNQQELDKILELHVKWLRDEPGGIRADLRGAILRRANLYGANLRRADLSGADLREANLYGTDLRGADLYGTDLRGADLRGADLSGADLSGADLRLADLYEADLREANLYGTDLRLADLSGADLRLADLRLADLSGADLSGADLRLADLYGTDLRRANLEDTAGLPPLTCPEKGEFIGFKKAYDTRDGCNVIVELLIRKTAKRSSATTRKCRCSKAKVLSITTLDGIPMNDAVAQSGYDSAFTYIVGKTVEVKNFDPDRWNECAPGIHFFITRQEAVDY